MKVTMHTKPPLSFGSISGVIAYAVLCCAAGLFLIIKPRLGAFVLAIIFFSLLCAYGVYNVIRFFRESKEAAPSHRLFSGLSYAAAGLVLLIKRKECESVVLLLSGFIPFALGFLRFQIAFDARRGQRPEWLMSLVAAVIYTVCGALVIFAFEIQRLPLRFCGGLLIFEAVCTLVLNIFADRRSEAVE